MQYCVSTIIALNLFHILISIIGNGHEHNSVSRGFRKFSRWELKLFAAFYTFIRILRVIIILFNIVLPVFITINSSPSNTSQLSSAGITHTYVILIHTQTRRFRTE